MPAALPVTIHKQWDGKLKSHLGFVNYNNHV